MSCPPANPHVCLQAINSLVALHEAMPAALRETSVRR